MTFVWFDPHRHVIESFQQTVSSGTFVLAVNELFVNVLFVTDSPIDGKPCDELECWPPFVVLAVLRPTFKLQNRLIAIKT